MVENSSIGQDDSRDAVLHAPDLEATTKNGASPAPIPAVLVLPPPARIFVAARAPGAAAARAPGAVAARPPGATAARAPGAAVKPKGFPVGAAAKKAAAKGGRPPLSPTSIAAATQKVQSQHLKRSLGDDAATTSRSKMLEALMCSQDWVRNKYKVDEKNKQPAIFWSCLQDIQEGLQELTI